MSEFVGKTEQRCDPGSQSDSGAFVPRGGLGLRKIGHYTKYTEKEETEGRATRVLRVFQRLK